MVSADNSPEISLEIMSGVLLRILSVIFAKFLKESLKKIPGAVRRTSQWLQIYIIQKFKEIKKILGAISEAIRAGIPDGNR